MDLIEQLKSPSNEGIHKVVENIANSADQEVVGGLVELMQYKNLETRFLAAKALSMIDSNQGALISLFNAIHDEENASIQGDLVATLEGFDVSAHYVEIFKLYLFGSFKVSRMAKTLLDYKEFDIKPRTVKKITKHWNHYSNNIKKDEAYELTKLEVEEIISDLNNYLDANTVE